MKDTIEFNVSPKVKGRKGGGGKAHTPVESPDSLRSNSKARMLLLLGEGPVQGGLDNTRIFLDGTPVGNSDGTMNFSGVKWEFRNGTQSQAPIKGFPAVESETQIGVALTKVSPWTRSISNVELDAVNIRIAFPQLVTRQDNGDTVGGRVDYQIELATGSGAFHLVQKYAAVGKTTTTYERTHRVDLPSSSTGWRVRVVRNTNDSTNQNIVNPTNIAAYTEIVDARCRYPLSALLYVEFDAKSFNGRIPKVSCLLDGLQMQVPSNYNPETRQYTGTWDGTFKYAFTDNAAWVFYMMATNKRFGLGDRLSGVNLDKWELYRIAQRCDQLVPDGKGGQEPRFRFNCYIQSREQAWNVLKDIAAGFSGMTYWGNQMLNVVSDMPTSVSQIVTRANVVEGDFIYASGSAKNHNSTFLVNYSDPSNHYKDVPASGVNHDIMRRFPNVAPLEITAIGCTRESEAQRRGHWALISNDIDRQVQFSIGAEGIDFLPGSVIAIADDRLSGRKMGGRLVEGTKTIIKVDGKTDAAAGDAFLINFGGVVSRVVIKSVSGSQIELSAPLPKEPVPSQVYVIDGVGLALQEFRVISMEWDDDKAVFKVNALEHNKDKYDAVDKKARLDTGRPITLIPTGIVDAPKNVAVSAYDTIFQGQRIKTMAATWLAVEGAVSYEAQWKRDNNDWINTLPTTSCSIEVNGIFAGNYTVRVRAVNSGGISSQWGVSPTVTLQGRVGAVPVPVGFVTKPLLWGIQLEWGFPADTEDTGYTEIQYATTNAAGDMQLLTNVAYPGKSYQQQGLRAGQEFFYRARLVDRIGNQSAWTSIIRGQSTASGGDYLDAIGDDLLTSEDGKRLTEGLENSMAATWENALHAGNVLYSQFAQLGPVRAELLQVATTIAQVDSAMADMSTDLRAQIAVTTQGIAGNTQDIAGNKQAIEYNTAAISEKLTAMVTATGASAIYTLRVGIKYNGQDILAGMSVAAISGGAGRPPVSRLAFNANQFVLLSGSGNTLYSPFAVKNGQTFISDTFIEDGSINNAKIGSFIQSSNYVANSEGWRLDKSGTLEINGSTPGQGRTKIDNNGQKVYDKNGTVRVIVGKY